MFFTTQISSFVSLIGPLNRRLLEETLLIKWFVNTKFYEQNLTDGISYKCHGKSSTAVAGIFKDLKNDPQKCSGVQDW